MGLGDTNTVRDFLRGGRRGRERPFLNANSFLQPKSHVAAP